MSSDSGPVAVANVITPQFAAEFAKEFVDSWNSHNLSRLMSHFTEDFEMSSPTVQLGGNSSGVLTGKDKVAEHWGRTLAAMPTLKFTLKDVFIGVNAVTICYWTEPRNMDAAAVLFFNPQRKCYRASAQHKI
eukprot:gnl/Hemi2/24584_TR8272_c0_g1_i1.p1 gnl/Hemi2/24584_TR8272_c0_g1~~gnl/Hemi2/24584_TR8272_c0_g1_i1.p1  ORF type:complete len:132 (+),score=24.01 gnl/Hemi2/24584_TR8272_c0_g1_i1:110-505(+)